VIFTVGAGYGVTVTVAVAVAVPAAPVAVAVYFVVEPGVTVSVPPVAAKEAVLPSVPVIVIPVEFVAVTVNTDDCPAVIEAGLATRVTAGWVVEAATVRLIVV
jgi:hypothetical protein